MDKPTLAITICFLAAVSMFGVLLNRTYAKCDKLVELLGRQYHVVLEAEKVNLAECQRERDQATALSRALSEIDPSDYNRQTNNCYDHSKWLQKELAENDIASSIMINQDRTHAWLAVWVEATNGHFLSAGKNWDILEVRDKNLNVICSK